MNLAKYIAEEWSKDPSTKVGAVIVGEHKTQVAVGYNGFPEGIEDSIERLESRTLKYALTQHAERNVLDHVSFSTRGATLYATMFPCSECAKSIITKGIGRVVAPDWKDGPERWHMECLSAHSMFREAGVEVDII